MENYNDNVFEFGSDTNNNFENTNNFNYDSISGLGQSDYENEDLFNTEVDYSENYLDNVVPNLPDQSEPVSEDNIDFAQEYKLDDLSDVIETPVAEQDEPKEELQSEEKVELPFDDVAKENTESMEIQQPEPEPETKKADETPANEVEEKEEPKVEKKTKKEREEIKIEDNKSDEKEKSSITLSDTPIEELNKLTEYKDEKIETADISDLFTKVGVKVKDASDVFKRNTELKSKIDLRFEELKKLQSEIENSKNNQKLEIDKYKEEVLEKLTQKKEEIEKRLNLLKETQSNLEKEKREFEEYKKKEQEHIDKVQKEVQSAYDDRREELSHIEDVLRKQKDALDEERSQLSLDKMEYESDKNELANNLLKFNDLVNSFTSGVNEVKE